VIRVLLAGLSRDSAEDMFCLSFYKALPGEYFVAKQIISATSSGILITRWAACCLTQTSVGGLFVEGEPETWRLVSNRSRKEKNEKEDFWELYYEVTRLKAICTMKNGVICSTM
jgi:hypothetical protein